jgi:dipeptidyl aminopeptidase/acylaminoacyl peptidase
MNRPDPKERTFSTDQLRAAFRGDVLPAWPGYLTDIVAEAGRTRQRPAWTFPGRWLPVDIGKQGVGIPRAAGVLMLTFLLVALLVTAGVYVGSQAKPVPVDLGIFAPVAGRVVYGDQRGMWGVDPAAPAAAAVQLTSAASIPLGWSSDGTRLLIMRGRARQVDADGQITQQPDEHLFVLHADGSEKQVTEGPMSINGATISPDGSRVVFAAATSDGGAALYAVDAQGGAAKVLIAADGCCQAPAYAPDGRRIAYISGGGDHGNSVWLMNADGSDAHPIVRNESDRWPGHVSGLVWSPAGDRLALGLGGKIYTFATDGSEFTEIAGADTACPSADICAVNLPKSAELPYWSPDGAQIAYTTGCLEGARAANREGCHLAIADADGSNVLAFASAASGPWHT